VDTGELARLRQARDLIDREYGQPLSVPAIAATACMSPAHFSRRYRQAFGETPHQHLLTRRIERAQALLAGGTLSVVQVCLAVGFTSVGSFSTRFRELTGCSPNRYRTLAPAAAGIPPCIARALGRPSRVREL
jgi:transcriptional regulator GlxA family with amidase domain